MGPMKHSRSKLMMCAFWGAGVALAFAMSASAQAIKNREVEGVFFLKQHSFTDPTKSTWAMEYRSASSNSQIILITTREGQSLRLLRGQVPDMIPYPGRGRITQAEALVLCDVALEKYPQYRALLTNVRKAWVRVGDSDYNQYAEPSLARQGLMDRVIDRMASEGERIQGEVAARPVQPFHTNSLLEPKPSPTPAAEASRTAEENSATEDDYISNLQKQAEEYTRQLRELQGGGE